MTNKAFRELKERILEKEGNIRFTDELLESLTEKQLAKLLDFYLSNVKLDNETKNKNVDLLEDALASSIIETEEVKEQPKKVALKKSSNKKKSSKKEVKKEKVKKEDNIKVDITKLKLKSKLIVIDKNDNYSIIEIRDIEPEYGILARDIHDLSNCFSISRDELKQGFYIHNKKQYWVDYFKEE